MRPHSVNAGARAMFKTDPFGHFLLCAHLCAATIAERSCFGCLFSQNGEKRNRCQYKSGKRCCEQAARRHFRYTSSRTWRIYLGYLYAERTYRRQITKATCPTLILFSLLSSMRFLFGLISFRCHRSHTPTLSTANPYN